MDELSALFHDGEKFDFGGFLPPESGARHKDAEAASLLAAIEAEISDMASLLAATSSILNALTSPHAPRVSAATLGVCIPPPAIVFPATLPRLVLSGLQCELLRDLQRYHARLRYLSNATTAWCSGSGSLHLDVLANGWCDLCRTTIAIRTRLAQVCERDPSRGLHAQTLLFQTAEGGWPCIDGDGTVEVPGMAERRRAVRYRVDWPATVATGTTATPITLHDLSRGGAGANGIRQFEKDTPVCLRIGSRSLPGQVVWSTTDRFGIKFHETLGPGDPLLQAARGRPLTA